MKVFRTLTAISSKPLEPAILTRSMEGPRRQTDRPTTTITVDALHATCSELEGLFLLTATAIQESAPIDESPSAGMGQVMACLPLLPFTRYPLKVVLSTAETYPASRRRFPCRTTLARPAAFVTPKALTVLGSSS